MASSKGVSLDFAGRRATAKRDVEELEGQLQGRMSPLANLETRKRNLTAAYSERRAPPGQKPCNVGEFTTPELRPDIAGAIKGVAAGGVSEPLKSDEGYQILRVDTRTAGSNSPTFNENAARIAMTGEQSPKAREDYLQNLRNDAYVNVAANYKDAVLPLLKIVPPPAVTKRDQPDKKKGKILGIIPRP